MTKPPPIFNPHRFARLIAWVLAMLAWAAVIFSTNAPSPNRRHIRQRYRALALDKFERLIRALAIIRVCEILHVRAPKHARIIRNAARAGFRRRTERGAYMRALAGARFRKALKHRDPAQRIQRLLSAIANLEAFVLRYLLARAKRRLTKLCAILICAPPAAVLVSLASPAPCAADSS
jgi:hypothetical protein